MFLVLVPNQVECNYDSYLKDLNYTNSTIIQRLSGKSKYIIENEFHNGTIPFEFSYNHDDFGETVATRFGVLCDIEPFLRLPKVLHYMGFILGSITLGIASDKGGRKMIILACIWTSGIMSVFQLVGHDFISFAFFQFFLGLFIGVSCIS